jgi:hypothetical protein
MDKYLHNLVAKIQIKGNNTKQKGENEKIFGQLVFYSYFRSQNRQRSEKIVVIPYSNVVHDAHARTTQTRGKSSVADHHRRH